MVLTERNRGKKKACIIAAIFVVFLLPLLPFLVYCSLTYYVRHVYKDFGEDEATSPMFYAEKGKKFSYNISFPCYQFEFTISEADFLDWCRDKEFPWEPFEIKDISSRSPRGYYFNKGGGSSVSIFGESAPLSIVRYCHVKEEHKGCEPWQHKPYESKQQVCQIDPTGKTDKACFRIVEDGYYYVHETYHVLYGREEQRCYVFYRRR